MNHESETVAMSHALTPARQNEILSHWNWTPEGKVRVQCTKRTQALLVFAGIVSPRVLEYYDVPVRRDKSGFLVVDHGEGVPQSAHSLEELFAAGGIFSGMRDMIDHQGSGASDNITKEEAAALLRKMLSEFRATRTFEVQVGPYQKLQISITGYVDASAEAPPWDVRKWEAKRPNNTEVHAAAQAIAMHRSLESCEIHPESDAAA